MKTGLLAGEPLWELDLAEQVRACAAFKAAVCLRDPLDRGERAQLNLGHTFAHALEAASGFALPHGRAVALGLLAALRLSGLTTRPPTVEEVLRPGAGRRSTASARGRRSSATRRRRAARVQLVLLERAGASRAVGRRARRRRACARPSTS